VRAADPWKMEDDEGGSSRASVGRLLLQPRPLYSVVFVVFLSAAQDRETVLPFYYSPLT